MKKCAGYIRVSSKRQADKGQSLDTQEEEIRSYAKRNDYDLVEIYADRGISGGSVKDRKALQKLISDGIEKKFEVVIFQRLSRFGRNARELLNNCNELINIGISFIFLEENIDYSNMYGNFLLTLLAAVAELERDVTNKQSMENKIAKAQQGIPTCGKYPIGRIYDKQSNTWSIDEEIAEHLRKAAKDFLSGTSLREIAYELKNIQGHSLGYRTLIKSLKYRCGDKWTVYYKDCEPIIYDIPRILDEDTIKQIHARLDHNRSNNRTDIKDFPLSGFLRCSKCYKSLSGKHQWSGKNRYRYYSHASGKFEPCHELTYIRAEIIERAVFNTLVESVLDKDQFNKALNENLPDEEYINGLNGQIIELNKQIQKIDVGLNRLVESVIAGSIRQDTIQLKENELCNRRDELIRKLEQLKDKLNNIPDLNTLKKDREQLRRELKEYFTSKQRIADMSYDDKRKYLLSIFNGTDEDGVPYGIYIEKIAKGVWNYFIYGNFDIGSKTVHKDNIDYYDDRVENYVDRVLNRDFDDYIKKESIVKEGHITRFHILDDGTPFPILNKELDSELEKLDTDNMKSRRRYKQQNMKNFYQNRSRCIVNSAQQQCFRGYPSSG